MMSPEKQALLDELRRNGAEATTALRHATPEVFATGVYESGWNGLQLLAHVASMEWTYARLIDIARQAREDGAADTATTAGDPPTRDFRGGNDAYNARQVEKRAGATVDELIAEFERNRERTLAAVEEANEDLLFGVPIRSGGGSTGPVATVLRAVAIGHVAGHIADLFDGRRSSPGS